MLMFVMLTQKMKIAMSLCRTVPCRDIPTDIIGNIAGLTKLNEEVLKNIQSLRKFSPEHAASFDNQINEIKQTIKLQVQAGNPIFNHNLTGPSTLSEGI